MSSTEGQGEGARASLAMQVAVERANARERITDLEGRLYHAEQSLSAAQTEVRMLKGLLREVAERHLLGQYDAWEGPGGRKETYARICAALGEEGET